MYILMVSRNAGASYNKDAQADSKEELSDRMDQLDDKEGVRWYLADGAEEQLFGVRICKIHKRLIESYFLTRVNGQNLSSREVD